MLPDELKALPQWVCAGPNKIPLDPKTGEVANVMDPRTWASYEVAIAAGFPHVGFVLTKNDPYCFIDLDQPVNDEQSWRHALVLSSFPDTYAEYSQSGRGIHIICRAAIPHGVRRDKVEMYSDSRYMITTGRVYHDKPIVDYQNVVNALFAEMDRASNAGAGELQEVDETIPDTEVILRATRAINADKFNKLCAGKWEGDYPSQSEADFALLSMLCFYTKSNAQVRRLFRHSKLGKREKAQRDAYLNAAITKIRAAEPPPIEFNLRLPPSHKPSTAPAPDVLDYPPGFLGDMARFITDTSLRPVAEVGIAAALALSAGIVGRQYNISNTGLNLYVILLAKTGVGKEGGSNGISRLMTKIRQQYASADCFVGPGAFSSGQAIIRALDQQTCFVSVLGEFGHFLQTLADASNTGFTAMMRKVLLDLYSKSGDGQILHPSVYSDREKNTKLIASPALTLLGESTPETFYSGISLGNVAEGLIPRFLLIEHHGDRPPKNKTPFAPPSPQLVQHLVNVVQITLSMQANNSVCHIGYVPEAEEMLDAFDKQCDKRVHSGGSDGIRQLWNRAHLKALRVAGLLAVMEDPSRPVVTPLDAAWAISLVQRDVRALEDRFTEGDVGEGDSKQVSDLRKAINEYLSRPLGELKGYGVTHKMHERGVIPYGYLFRRLSQLASYRKDRRGAKMALHTALDVMVMSGNLHEVAPEQIKEIAGTVQKAFWVPNGNGNGTHT